MQWLLISTSLAVVYVALCLWTILTNYVKARATGYTIFICPVNPSNPFWMAFSVPLQPICARFLPSFAYERIRRTIYGWEFREKSAGLNGRPDPAFLLVTPGKNELWVEDAELGSMILSRRKDFIQFDIASLVMGIFGPNVITVGIPSSCHNVKSARVK